MVSSGGFDYIVTHQETRLYVGPGQTPQCFIVVPQNSGGDGTFNISGFLVDVPEGGFPAVAPAQTESPMSWLRRFMGARQLNNSGHQSPALEECCIARFLKPIGMEKRHDEDSHQENSDGSLLL